MSLNRALTNYINSLQIGETAQNDKWKDEMFQKFSNLISELSSEKQAVFIFGIHQKICHYGYDKLACEIMLQYGEDVLPQALEFFGKYRVSHPNGDNFGLNFLFLNHICQKVRPVLKSL